MGKNITTSRKIFRYDNGELTQQEDQMATEFPLTVMVNGEEFVTLVCSPDSLEELVIGFLASEGVIRFKNEIKRFTIDESLGFAYVDLVSPKKLRLKDYTKAGDRLLLRKRAAFLFPAGRQNRKNGD
jgi:FdhD protein